MPPPTVLGSRLRAERALSGTSLRELARRLGISASALSQIERGLAHPSLLTIVSLATELRLSLDDLLDVRRPGRPAPSLGTVVSSNAARATTELSPGVRCSTIANEPETGFLLVLACLDPGAIACKDVLPLSGGGGGFAVAVAGSLQVDTREGTDRLSPGAAVELSWGTFVEIRNESGEAASLLLGSQRGDVPAPAAAATPGSSPVRRRRG